MHNTKRKYGWKKQKHDERDIQYKAKIVHLPPLVDLRNVKSMPPVYDQGQLGSCTANAIGAAIDFDYKVPFMPSRLFIYYNERVIEGTVKQDDGAEIRDGIKSVNKKGVCDETIWPYDVKKFSQKPTPDCFTEAKLHQSVKYMAVHQSEDAIKQALADGLPVIFGFNVKESFESDAVAQTGFYDPQTGEKIVGGHAVIIVGYDNKKQIFIVRNSWGADWGQKGYFVMPYYEVLDPKISNDFWVINIME